MANVPLTNGGWMMRKTMQQTKRFSRMRRSRWFGGILVLLLMLSGAAANLQPCVGEALTVLAAGESSKKGEESSAERIALSQKKITINIGETYQLSVSGAYKELTWKVKKESVATISEKGVVKGVRVGTTTVYAIVDGIRYSCKVVVENPKTEVASFTGIVGSTAEFLISGTSRKPIFSSADSSIASVSKDGVIKFKKLGTTMIYAEVGNKKLSCKVTVVRSLLADLFDSIGKLAVLQEKLTEEVTEIYDRIITPEMTDFEKLLAFHDYIVLHTEYDHENYENDSLPDSAYSEEGVFFDGRAVCRGYAEALKMLLDMADVENKLVFGYGWDNETGDWESHAWNLVKLDGDWYHVDTTWDDPDVPESVSYAYFCIPDEIMDDDHNWKKRDYPKATGGEYTDYIINELLQSGY